MAIYNHKNTVGDDENNKFIDEYRPRLNTFICSSHVDVYYETAYFKCNIYFRYKLENSYLN